jgi:hypothetical protein
MPTMGVSVATGCWVGRRTMLDAYQTEPDDDMSILQPIRFLKNFLSFHG